MLSKMQIAGIFWRQQDPDHDFPTAAVSISKPPPLCCWHNMWPTPKDFSSTYSSLRVMTDFGRFTLINKSLCLMTGKPLRLVHCVLVLFEPSWFSQSLLLFRASGRRPPVVSWLDVQGHFLTLWKWLQWSCEMKREISKLFYIRGLTFRVTFWLCGNSCNGVVKWKGK